MDATFLEAAGPDRQSAMIHALEVSYPALRSLPAAFVRVAWALSCGGAMKFTNRLLFVSIMLLSNQWASCIVTRRA